MTCEIIAIGDELLSGDILDTNTQYISDKLWTQGFKVEYHVSVRDDELQIINVLRQAATRSKIVIVTGGLGPTVDDFTIEVAAKAFDVALKEDAGTVAYLEKIFKKRERTLSANNRKQALIPEGGKVLFNKLGTAPGVRFEYKGAVFYFMPGVPFEMKAILEQDVLPDLDSCREEGLLFKTHFLKLFGCAESEVDNRLKDLMLDRMNIGNARIGFRAHFPEVWLKVSVWGDDEAKVESELEDVVAQILKRLGEFVYAQNKVASLESCLIQKLREQDCSIATAESCTGGLIAHRLTNVSGASEVFEGGLVTYSNSLKENLLNVDPEIIETYGAVSEECAIAMVQGLVKKTLVDYAVSVTGIAGPTGGTQDKPEGTVFVAYAIKGEIHCEKYFYPFDRQRFKDIVSSRVLATLLRS